MFEPLGNQFHNDSAGPVAFLVMPTNAIRSFNIARLDRETQVFEQLGHFFNRIFNVVLIFWNTLIKIVTQNKALVLDVQYNLNFSIC